MDAAFSHTCAPASLPHEKHHNWPFLGLHKARGRQRKRKNRIGSSDGCQPKRSAPVKDLFTPFIGFSRQEYSSGLPFPSPVDHVLSEISTMTCPSWVALQGIAHSFTELEKAVVHVISLVSFL